MTTPTVTTSPPASYVLYGRPIPGPPLYRDASGEVVTGPGIPDGMRMHRLDWNARTTTVVSLPAIVWLMEVHGWPASAALEAAAVAWANARTTNDPRGRTVNVSSDGNAEGIGPFGLTAAEAAAAGVTRETRPPYGPASAFTAPGIVEAVSRVTANGSNLARFSRWHDEPDYRTGRTIATAVASELEAARARFGPEWTPFDVDPGAALNQPIPVVDQAGAILGAVWDAASAVPATLALVAKILGNLLSASWWRRLGVGILGVALVGVAIILATQ